uniref:Uncharacterized protein n=1 Tax=Romanomermis culicivorax TaxID=13658 RepID=A0A915HXC7_ROMCU
MNSGEALFRLIPHTKRVIRNGVDVLNKCKSTTLVPSLLYRKTGKSSRFYGKGSTDKLNHRHHPGMFIDNDDDEEKEATLTDTNRTYLGSSSKLYGETQSKSSRIDRNFFFRLNWRREKYQLMPADCLRQTTKRSSENNPKIRQIPKQNTEDR